MKHIKMDAEALKQVFSEKYGELMNGSALPASTTIQLNPSIKLAEDQKVEVWFRTKAYKKMMGLIDQCPKEIGWHGVVEKTDAKHYQITDILVFPQNVTGATVTPDEAEYTQWMIDLAMNNEDAFNHMRFHGHSHVNMATTPSKVDTDYQENLTKNIDDFYIFGIFNKSGSWWLNIWDMENNILYEKDDIKYLYEPEEEESWAEEQIKKYVKENVYTSKKATSTTTTTSSTGIANTTDYTTPTTTTTTKKVQSNPVKDNYGSGDYDDDWDEFYYGSYYRNKGKGYGGYNYD